MDANAHVNNGIYQHFFDEARMQALASVGFSIERLREEKVGPVITRAELEYKKPLSHPDSVEVETGFAEVSKYRGKILQRMKRVSDGGLVCEAIFTALFYDFNKKRPWALPEEFQNRFGKT